VIPDNITRRACFTGEFMLSGWSSVIGFALH
jgi:hypothetical protein